MCILEPHFCLPNSLLLLLATNLTWTLPPSPQHKHVNSGWPGWQRRQEHVSNVAPHLLSVPQTGAPRRAPAVPPRSTSGRRTTPFAFSAWLCSSVGSASLLLWRSSPASLQPPRGPWRSSLGASVPAEPPGGGAEVRGTEASRGGRGGGETGCVCVCVCALNLLDESRYDLLVDGFVKSDRVGEKKKIVRSKISK